MKIYYFSENDNIYKIFNVLDKFPKRKKKIFLEIDHKNNFFSNKWWLKLVLEKSQELWIIPIFIITNTKQELLLKTFWVNYIWKKEPLSQKILNNLLEFKNIFKSNFSWKYSKTFKLIIVIWEFLILVWSWYFIYNLITPKTDIYIQPSVRIKHLVQKFYVWAKNNNIDIKLPLLNLYTWEFVKNISVKLPVEDIKYLSKPAKWIVKFINYSNVWYSLKAHTQLITDNWLIFRINNWVYIPNAKSPTNPWTAIVGVTADKKDINWQIIWSRWNVYKWTKFYIRKMYISVWKKKVYAIAHVNFTNWQLNPTWVVKVNDIENVKKYLKQTLEKNIVNYIKNYTSSNSKWQYFLAFSWMYNVYNYQYFINAKPWDKLPYIHWDLQVKIIYSYVKTEEIKNLFKKYLKDHIVTMSDFIWWNDASLQVISIEKVFDNLYIITVNFDALLWYDFKKDYNKIKDQILNQIPWSSIERAKEIILSYPVIAWVEIKTTNSLWIISRLKSRISIHIVK